MLKGYPLAAITLLTPAQLAHKWCLYYKSHRHIESSGLKTTQAMRVNLAEPQHNVRDTSSFWVIGTTNITFWR